MQNVRKGILRSPRKLMNCNDSVQSSAAIRNFMKHRKYHKIDKCSEEYCRLYINNGHGNNAYNHLQPSAGNHNGSYRGDSSKLGEMFQNYTQTSTESSYFNHNRDDISVLSDDKPAHYNDYTYSEIDAHIWDDSSIPDLVPTNYQRENNRASNNAINYKWLKNHINQSKINREINPPYYYNDSDPVTFIESLDCCPGEYYNSDECHLKTDRKFRNIDCGNTTQKSLCTYNPINNKDTNKEWAIDSNHNLNLNHLETYKKLTSIEYFQNNVGYNHDNVSTMTRFRPDDKWEYDNYIKNSSSMEHFSKHNHFATFIKKTNGNMSMNSKTTRQNTLADKMKEFSIYPKSCDMQKKCEIENCFTKDLFTKDMKTSQEMYKSNQLICDLYLGTYHIISDLGKGTYGTVKLAYNITEERKVALKFISKKNVMKKKQIQRVHNEVKILSILSHPNICKMYRAIETRDEYVLEMEYVRGRELFNYIKMRKRLTEKEAKEIFLQILDGVNYLHQHKIIHRDLKPENMIIDDEGRIKIIDFGFSNTFEYGHYSEVHCGSPYYASPEMVNSMPYIGPEVDVWSMGIILYAMVHGKQPFLGSEVKAVYANILKCDYKLDQNISLGLADLIRRIICLDADKRITINEIANHKWISPYHLPIYPKKFIYNAERRVVLRLADFGFVGQLIFTKLKNPLSTESNFYRLLLNKFNTEKVVYNKIGKVLNKKEFFSEMKMIKESMRSHGSKVYPSCGKESHKTFAIMSEESSKALKEINEIILCNKDRLTRRYNDYIIDKRYRYRNDIDYIQVLVAKKESFLMRIFIDTINPLKCNVKFMLICGNEDIFTEVVSDMISTIY